jgi:hypothetical protein
MIRRQFAALLLLFTLVVPYVAFGQQPQGQQQTAVDPNDPIVKIRDEGLNRSQVMQTLSYLSDVIGPRLTASPGMKRANEWTRETMAKWGLQNAHLEAWGPFGRGWTLKRFSAQVTEPLAIPLIAYPKAWSPGTNGPVSADVIFFDPKDEADLARFTGQLKGKIVLTSPIREVKAHFETQGTRRDEKNLLTLANAPMPRPGGGRGGFGGGNNPQALALRSLRPGETSSCWMKARRFWSMRVAATAEPSSCNQPLCRSLSRRTRSDRMHRVASIRTTKTRRWCRKCR